MKTPQSNRDSDAPYRIGIITRPIDQKTSGSCNYQRQLLNALLDSDHGFDITLIHYQKSNDPVYTRPEITERIIPRDPIRASIAISRMHLDLLHYAPYTILSPLWARTRCRMASILGAGPLFIPDEYSRLHNLHARLVEPLIIRRLDAVLSCSHTSSNFVRKRYRFKGLICVAYAGIAKAFIPPGLGDTLPKRLRRVHGITDKYLLHISRYSKRKNPMTLLDGFRIYHQRNQPSQSIQLVVAGSEWENEHVKDYIKQHGLEDAVRFTGYAKEQDLINLLQYADAFVFPSLYEGFGMPNIEAMACDCPVITSDAFAIPEVVGEAALILKDKRSAPELADLITRVAHDPSEREKLRQAGRRNVDRFSWQESASILGNAYRACIDNA
jgi:glycosyltransferase involved in cell wall biosynthesis